MERSVEKTGVEVVREFVADLPSLRDLARQIVGRGGSFNHQFAERRRMDVEELIQDGAALLLAKAEAYKASEGGVRAWAYRVMKNRYLDVKRKERTKKRGSGKTMQWDLMQIESSDAQHILHSRDELDLAQTVEMVFTEADLAVMEARLKPQPRLITILMLEICGVIPVSRLEKWCGAADCDWALFRKCQQTEKEERCGMLSDWSGKSHNAISQICRRSKSVLRELPSMVQLERGHQ